jgi:hypothetical protein
MLHASCIVCKSTAIARVLRGLRLSSMLYRIWQQQQQQQQGQAVLAPLQQPTPSGHLYPVSCNSRKCRPAALSCTSSHAAPSLLPRAALAAVTTAAAAAMAPAGASLASFQGSRYTGSSSVAPPGDYWLRQMGLDGSKMTALLVAANVGCFGMQQLSTTFTSYCVRVGREWVGSGLGVYAMCWCDEVQCWPALQALRLTLQGCLGLFPKP